MTAGKGIVVPAGAGPVHRDAKAPDRATVLKLLGRETDGSIMMFEQAVPAGTRSWFHLHDDSDEVAWVLAGIHQGLTRQLEPPPVTTGNAYHRPGEPLPVYWSEALERFGCSAIARQYFGEKFVKLYSTVKRGELEEFGSHITPLEIARYLGPL